MSFTDRVPRLRDFSYLESQYSAQVNWLQWFPLIHILILISEINGTKQKVKSMLWWYSFLNKVLSVTTPSLSSQTHFSHLFHSFLALLLIIPPKQSEKELTTNHVSVTLCYFKWISNYLFHWNVLTLVSHFAILQRDKNDSTVLENEDRDESWAKHCSSSFTWE